MKKNFLYVLLLAGSVLFHTSMAHAQSTYQKPTLENKKSFTVIMLPDIQNYVKWGANQPILELMSAWIDSNIDSLNIKMVLCMGDLVNNNEKITNDYDGDQTTLQQWKAAAHAFDRFNGKIPYIAATGNHDYSIDREGNRTSLYNQFFNIEKNYLNQKYLVQNSRDEQGQQTLANSAYELKNLNGKDYLFMTVEYAPRDTVLNWAKKVAAMQEYKNHRIVMSTHSYVTTKDSLGGGDISWLYWEPYRVNNMIQKSKRITLPFANNGKQIWEKFVKPSSNIELVLSGHYSGEGYLKNKNDKGKSVHQIMFDAQSMGGGGRTGNGGDGWLRILEFFPDNKTVKVRTFSPLFGISPTSQPNAWKKDGRNEYIIRFE
ncbi:metallophosphoesterase [Pedobacter insulae]|uniref:Calcineurin-like phosphoesterase n=1 Tax=Pedobacter insulae TaxID=414048 RepID=A0A1I2UUQ8_9SPHI|nr:metallophosphoesterase [Pedobacter insulae]SFG80904.1 Calcineurin-like phosphoesterase [Pedobacter insulae]